MSESQIWNDIRAGRTPAFTDALRGPVRDGIVIAEKDGIQVWGKLSGEKQSFFAVNREFDDQLYFMQLVATRGESDKVVEEIIDATCPGARLTYEPTPLKVEE